MSRPNRAVTVALASVLLVLSACGNSKGTTSDSSTKATAPTDGGEANRDVHKEIDGVPGVTDDTISYDVVGTKQGNPLGTCILDCYVDGINAYFAYRNAQGGIYGRELKVGNVADDQLANNQAEALKITSSNDAFGAFQAGLLQQGWGDLNDAGVPTYTWGIDGASAANREAIFPSTVISCPDCTRRILPYLAMKAGAKKAASLGYSTSQTSQMCADSIADSFDLYEKDTGVANAYLKDDLPYGLPNGIGPEVTAMKKAGVDFISTCFDLNAMKTLAEELKRQGMGDVPLYHPNTYNQQFVADADGLFEGDYVGVEFRPFEAQNNEALKAFKTWMKKTGSQPSELAMVGWINATAAYDGLLAAGPEFDREKVIAGTNALHDFTADGLINSIDWSTAHTPYTQKTRTKVKEKECGNTVQVTDGKFEVVAPADEPWLCWDSQDLSWSEPTPTNFD